MPEHFDPYRKWLGIPSEEQPPHYYRLLGLAPFEHDPDVIENAADQRMAHVRTFQSGRHAVLSQRILTELSAAKVCLLNEEKKAAYDEELQAGIYGAANWEADFDAARKTTAAKAAARHWPDWHVGVLLGSIASSIILIVGGAMIFAGGKQDAPVADAGSNRATDKAHPNGDAGSSSGGSSTTSGIGGNTSNPKDKKPSDPNKGGSKPPDSKIGELPVVPFDDGNDPKTPSGLVPPKEPPAAEPVKTPPKEPPKIPVSVSPVPVPAVPVSPPPVSPVPLPPAAPFELIPVTDQAVDLLKRIDPKTHAVVGEWKFDGGSLVSGAERPILQLPCTIPPEYVLSLIAHRRDGTEEFDIGLVSGGRQFTLVLGRSSGHWAGLEAIDNVWTGAKNPTSRASANVFRGGTPVCIQAIVLKGRVVVLVDGERIIDWSGEPRRLTSSALRLPSGAPGLFLSTNLSSFAVNRLLITPLVNGHLPLPSEGELTTAEAKTKKHLGDPTKLKQKTREEKLRLATDLFARAAASIDDRPAQFVLLREALNVAVEAGSLEWAWKIASEQALWFGVDPLEKVADALDRAKKATLLPEIGHDLAEGASALMDEAAAAQNLTAADRLWLAAKSFAGRAKSEPALSAELTQRTKWIGQQHLLADGVKKAQETLEAAPADAEANLALGRYYALSVGDWNRAMPYLAKSESGALHDVAVHDLTSPVVPERQVLLADDWYQNAQSLSKKDDSLSPRCSARARHWYELALNNNLQGAAKASVEKRLAEMSPGNGLTAEIYPAPYGTINFKQPYKSRVDRLIDFAWKTDPPDVGVPVSLYAFHWNGWLAVPKAGQYELITDSHHYIRLWLDGELVIDQWGATHATRVDFSRFLLSKPYAL